MTNKPFDFDNFNTNDSSTDDNQSFQEMILDVNKIKTNQAQPYKKKHRPIPLNIPIEKSEDTRFADHQIDTFDLLSYQSAGIQNRLFKELGKGYIKPEGSLDLHGRRITEAHKIFNQFINDAIYHRARCVRIIHGKGHRSTDNQPILKQKTNQWLRQRDEVLAFISAPSWDGGTGAVYVLLSKKHHPND